MSIFGKNNIELLLEPYKMQIDMLKEHIERLEKQNKVLTEALVAAKSPDAYREMKADEAALSNYNEIPPEQKRKKELEYEIQKQWIENLEAPVFNSFDEFEAFLRRKNPPTDKDVELEPLHPNNPES